MDQNEIEKYIKAGRIAGEAIKLGKNLIEEGKRAEDVADEIESFIIKSGAKPAFPVNLSVSDEAAHYTPSRNDNRIFKKGDVVKIDLGAHVDGYIADTAITIEIGGNDKKTLSMASETALRTVINSIRPGIETWELGSIIERVIESFGYKPIYNLTGHQVSKFVLHAGISIPNYNDGSRKSLYSDMAVAIEPFATDGSGYVKETKFGNIAQIIRINDETKRIFEEYNNLPFSTRWIYRDFSDPEHIMDIVMKSKDIYRFPILKEKAKGTVSQHEHTILLLKDRIIVTTEI